MSCAVTFYLHGLRELGDAALLVLVGRCGTAGLSAQVGAAALGMEPATARRSLRRLERAGYVTAPSRDTGRGMPLRYTIRPHGLAVLQTVVTVTLPAQQIPFPIPPMP